MEFYDVISHRHTIRDFSNREVSNGKLQRVIAAGLKAPTNDHMRCWEFIVVRDREKISTLLRTIPKTFDSEQLADIFRNWDINDPIQQAMYADGIPKQHAMLLSSGCLVLPLYKQSGDLLKPESLSSLNAFASIWCCVENMLLAATYEGLGVALRIPFSEDSANILAITGHPPEYVVPCMLAFGYPSEDAPAIRQFEPDVQTKIHLDTW